jgi:hypothetical protein
MLSSFGTAGREGFGKRNVNKVSKSGTLRKNERQATTLEKERTDDVGVEEEEKERKLMRSGGRSLKIIRGRK